MIAPMEAGPLLSPESLAEIRDKLTALYRELDDAVAMMGPVCQLSGRCCRFKEHGHTLFLSAPEAQLLVADAPQPRGQLDNGESCPWQDARGRCTARDARPLGCRVFYFDPAFETLAPELSETFLARLKQLASQHDWLWNYAPLHQHLRQAQVEGRLKIASAGSDIQPEGPLVASSELRTNTAAGAERSGERAPVGC
jgi:Fe-S-cluster containining protein